MDSVERTEWVEWEGPWRVAAGTPGNERFGALVKYLRERSGLTPQELADQVGVHVSFVRGIERGAQAPSMAKAKPLLSRLKEQDRITWLDEPGTDGTVIDSFTGKPRRVAPNGPDLVIRDPKIGRDVAFEFKAKVKGQNKRPDVGKKFVPWQTVRSGAVVGSAAAVVVAAEAVLAMQAARRGERRGGEVVEPDDGRTVHAGFRELDGIDSVDLLDEASVAEFRRAVDALAAAAAAATAPEAPDGADATGAGRAATSVSRKPDPADGVREDPASVSVNEEHDARVGRIVRMLAVADPETLDAVEAYLFDAQSTRTRGPARG